MYKTLSFLLLVAAVHSDLASEDPTNADYEAWKSKHGLRFDEHEDRYRKFIYRQAQSEIRAHNQNPDNTWKKG